MDSASTAGVDETLRLQQQSGPEVSQSDQLCIIQPSLRALMSVNYALACYNWSRRC